MPWCPVCKNEYREGFTHCKSCDVDLVDSLEEGPVAVVVGEQNTLLDMCEFLKANGHSEPFMAYNEKEQHFVLFVKQEEEKAVRDKLAIYMQRRAIKQQADEAGVSEEEYMRMLKMGQVNRSGIPQGKDPDAYNATEIDEMQEETIYVDKHQKAEDVKSSSVALSIVGIAGLIGIVLLCLDVLPIHFYGSSKYLISGVMGALFVGFIIMGISSAKSYTRYLVIALEEDELKKEIQALLEKDASKEIVDQKSGVAKDADEADPQTYYARMAVIKGVLNAGFPKAEKALLEKMADDYYASLYDEV